MDCGGYAAASYCERLPVNSALGFNTRPGMADSEQVKALVAEQMAMIQDPARREALRTLLLPEPRQEERAWDYGAPGEHYPYWVVAEAPERGLLFVYCEQGFG